MMEMSLKRAGVSLSLLFTCILSFTNAFAQTVSFTSTTLIGDNLSQPTSLQFGPDGRLYVAEQLGRILVYTVTRNSANSYEVTDTEVINLIKQIPNHNDDGTVNALVNTRQVTGIVVAGTSANPVIFVTSSDPRSGGGVQANYDVNLDTNSGIVSRLTWNGTQWVKLDLVRGLPRSEESHSPNGLAYDKVNNILYMAQGGNTNMGAPSNNFAYLPEYAYSTAILKIDLNAIGNTTYDLPTLDDETRSNVGGAGYEDVNDPFGGNDGLNQGKLVAGGPVTVYSPGWRNNYDIVITQAGRMYSFDNGPNGGWGGPPTACSIAASEPGTTYCDGLHYVSSQGYYAGFPNPVRANRSITFNASNPQTPIPLGMENPAECNYIAPGSNGSLTAVCSSTNGMTEYTASNFSNAMKGNLLAVAFNGKIYRYKLNAAGNAIVSITQPVLAQGFGSTPLDLVAQGDNDIFPGTIWVAMYGGNDIVVFEPNDFAACAGDANNMSLDDDGDGYKNGDETQNATDKCSPASVPSDFDHDYVSDLLDTDDDNDGILDNTDKFAQDANNGTTTTIPVMYTYQNTNEGGIGGWGFTGVMTNNVSDYMSLYDMDNMTVGGAAYKFTVDNIPSGDALGALNNQKYAYQFGVNVGSFPFGYVVNGRVMGPFAGLTPTNFRSMGVFMGTGDQDNYLKMVCAANGGAGGIEIVKEEGGVVTSTMYNVAILGSSHVNMYLQVDPTTQMVQPSYSIGGGARTNLGPQIPVPASWLSNVLAVGFISTSRGATPFSATWDYIAVEPVEGVGNWVNINTGNTCTARHESAFVECGTKFYLLGGRGTKPVEVYNYNSKTWSTAAAPPVQLHHFQAVALNGLIYVVGAFTGNFPNETPVPNVYIYDPVANTWHVGMDIPTDRRRGSTGAVVYNEKIYVVSGLTNGHVSGWVPYMDVFDPQTNTWTALPDAPHSRDHFQVAIHGDQIYAIGGRNSGYGGNTYAYTIAETDVYDISEQTWTTLSSPEGDIPTQRAACAVAVMGDEILAIGGESMSQNAAHAHTEALDVNTNSWRTLDDLNTGRHGTQAIVNNYGIYIAAGCGARGGSPELNSVEAFYLFGQTTPTGTAVTKGALTVSPGNLNYGNVHLGNSASQKLYITNPGGNQALVIKGLSMSGGGNYSFVSPYTMPIVLNTGDTLAVNITFAPASTGTKNGTFTISHSGTNAVNTIINMTGNGVGQQSTVRINTGGPSYTTAATENFIADTYYNNYAGSTSSTIQAIAGTTEDALYQTERYGNAFGYAVPVQNGSYTVKLHFAEIWSGASNTGVRVFDASIEGALVIDDLDIYSVAGMYTAHVRTFNVTVSDGTINIDFAASVNNAKVNAIEIIAPVATQGVLTAVPSSMIFPQTNVNVISSPMTLSLTNTGGASLTINSVSISGTNASNFLHSFGSSVTLAVGATHAFTVTFTPSASGARTATMSINHTGSNSPLSVSLSGTGSSTVASCGYFVEQNGLLVMEIENAPATQGWTPETTYPSYTGTEYYTWTGPNYFQEKGHGMLTYEFKINNPGKYRFKMRTRNGGPLNTHNNDVWVRFPDHGCTFEKNGQVQTSASGWWKQWQNNLGGWTYNSWAGESAFWEVYVEFPFAGVYTMDISGRAQLYSLDRIVFYRMDMVSDWNATASNPPQSPWENCPSTPLVWYKDADKDYYGSPTDSVISVSKPGVGYVWNKLDCDDAHGSVYPGAPEILDGRDNDCDGVKDEGAYLTALNINCGGSTHNAINGDVFESDRLYSLPSSAKFYSGIGDILNTDDDALFKSERITSTSNNLKYDFKAVPGLYTVTLYFAEQATVMNPGERVFDVMVEDSVILNDLDIIATVGYKTAYSYTYNLRLMDSTLNVKVVDVIGKAKINAIKVAQKPNTPPTFTISGSSTFNEDFVGVNVMNVNPAAVPPYEAWQVVTYSLTPASVSFANVSINSSTGQVSITSIPNMVGQQQFTITANDGYATNNIATKTFTLKVNAVNDAPAFTLSGNVTVNEDFAGTQTISVTPVTVPSDETSQVVTYSLSPASVLFASISFSVTAGQVSITSLPEMSGSQVFTVTANDGQAANNTAAQTFTLTVNAVNDAPTLNAISDITIDEDAGIQTVNLNGIGAGGNETQTLSVSAVSDNVSLIPNPSVSYTSANATGSLSFVPVANKSGVAHITVTVNDGGLTYYRTFTVTVNPVNDAPVFSMSGNVSVSEDFAAAQQVIVIAGSFPSDEMSQSVSYSLSPASVSFANVSINRATGEVTITSVADASGSQMFTVTADDGQSQNNIANATFSLTVSSVNDMPAFTLSGDVSVNEDFASTENITMMPAPVPADEVSQVVNYSLSPSSVGFANVSFNSMNGEVNITSIANASGSQMFTITANDGQSQNNNYSQTFTLTVNSVNDVPAFTLSGDVTVNEDFAATQVVSATPLPVPSDEAIQTVTYTLSPASVSFANVSINSATGKVSITSIANASGSQLFTIIANDGQPQNNNYSQTFTLTVNSVNDAPAFTLSGNVTVDEDFATAEVVSVSAGFVPANEMTQVVSYNLSPSSVNFANVSFSSITGEVVITSIANASGSQMFTVTANDGQSQNNLYSQTFTLAVNSVNDAPAFTASGDVTVNEDFSTTEIVTMTQGFVPADEMSQGVSYSLSPSSVNFANISFNSNTGKVTITSVPNANGSQMFTVVANDGQSQNNTNSQTFMVTVNAVNDVPAFTLSGNVTVSEDFAVAQHVTVTPSSVPADESSQVVTYSIAPSSVSFANVSINSSTGEVTVSALSNAFGTQLFNVTANDGQSQSNSHSQTFILTINSVNDAPSFTLSGNITVNEDFGTVQHVTVTPAAVPADEVNQVVTYNISPLSVSFANVSINNSTGEVTITSVSNASGTQMFTVTASDGQSQNNTYSQTFTLTVISANDAPVFTVSGAVAVNEDFSTTENVIVTPGFIPSDELSQTVAYSLSPASVSFANVSINSTTGKVTITSVANASGTQLFMIIANDGQSQNNTYSRTFTLTVNAVNDAPAFTLSGDVTVNEDFAVAQHVTVTPAAVPANETTQVVTYSMSPSTVSFATVSINSSTGEVSITSIANASGSQMFTVTANDGQSQNNASSKTFMLTVNSVNDAPAFTLSGDLTLNEDFATVQHVMATPVAVPANELSQIVTYSLSPSIVSFADVSINSNTGEVTINALANASGSQIFTVTANDGQSQNNTYSRTFALTVAAVNDAPVFTLSGDVTVIEGQYTSATVIVTPGAVPADEMSQIVTYSILPSSVGIANVSINSSTGEVTITAVPNQFGVQVFTITANDGQSQNNNYSQTFTLIIEEGNNPPAFTTSGNIVVDEDFATTKTVIVTPGPVRPFEAGQVVTYSLSPSSVSFANVSFDSNTGNVTITSVANAYGSQQFTITADDGQNRNNLYSAIFMLTVNSINDEPAFTLSGDINENEDFAGTKNVTVTKGLVPANEMSQAVVYSISPSVSFANVSINPATGDVTISSIPNAYGSQLLTITANDGQSINNSYTATFTLTVNPVNDQPTLNPISNPGAVLEDSGLSTVNLTGISAGAGENQTLTVTAVSNNPSLLSMLNVSYTNPAILGTVSFQPAPNMWGSATITVVVNDSQSVNNLISQTFVITVTSVNDAPGFTTTQSNITVAEDFTGTQIISPIPFQVPTDEAGQVVSYSLSPASVPFANIQFNSSTGQVQITSVPNASGSGTFTVTANDGQSQNNTYAQTFVLTVNSVNDAPVFSINPSIATVLKNFTSNEIINVTPALVPADEVPQIVTYSLNPASVSFANISFSSLTGSVSITSIANMSGSQTFTLTANDGQSVNNLHSEQFVFTVIDTNYQPTLTAINNPTAINEDTGIQVIQLAGITSGFNESQVITVTAVSDNPSLIPNPAVTYTNPANIGTISYAPLANQYGVAVVTVTVNDGESENNTISRSFTVTVNPANDQPTLNAINDPSSILEDAPMQTIMMSGISAGPNEFEALVITASSSNPSLIANPTVAYNNPNATGMLQYAPAANQFGSALITVTVNDGKLVNNIISRAFTVIVNPVNDAPVLSDIFKNGQEDKNLGFQVGNFKNNMTDIEGDTLEKIRIVSLPDNGILLINGNPVSAMTEITISDISSLIYDPLNEFSGVDSFLWNGFAGSLYSLNSANVYLNMNNVNDKPYVVSHIADITVNEDAVAISNYADLKNIFNDIEDGVNMTYTVILNTNNSLADVVIDASQTLDISFGANANGNAIVAIQAKDKDGATITDTFKLVVNSVEDVPAIFSLLTPLDGSAIANPNAIDFSWDASTDGDEDDLTYAVTIRGYNLDTTISVMSATSVLLGGSSLFTMDSTYQWFVTASDGDDVTASSTFRFRISVTGVSDPYTLISTVEAYPNPFNSSARIRYVLKADSRVTLKIYNFIGQEIETIANEEQSQGEHIRLWDAGNETSGVYFYELIMETDSGMEGSFIGKFIKQ